MIVKSYNLHLTFVPLFVSPSSILLEWSTIFNFTILHSITLQFVVFEKFASAYQGSYPFSETNFQHSKIHINPYYPSISMLILLITIHTLHIFLLSLTDFQNFPGPVAFFQDFSVLENARIKKGPLERTKTVLLNS